MKVAAITLLAGTASAFAPAQTGKSSTALNAVEWLREAELAHGRIAQLAVVGFLWPGLFGTFPGSDEFGGVDAYSELNPFKALTTVPESALFQIVAGAAWFEYQRVIRIREQGADRVLGDIGIGYPGGWNPLNLNYG